MTNDSGIVVNSLPVIDRNSDYRAKVSRKRFLAFIMVGIMIVAAVSMIAPSMLGNNGQNDDDHQIAKISWNPAGKREAIYKIDHLFELYLKNGGGFLDSTGTTVSNGAGRGGLLNNSIAYHGGAGAANQNAHPAQERYLGHANQSLMGVNDWLNSTWGFDTSPRASTYSEYMLRNTYPYIGYWNPAPTGKLTPTLPPGLATWAPFRMTCTVKNDTAMKTGWSDLNDQSRNVPFLPYWNRSRGDTNNYRGGYVNLSSYGTYLTANDMDQLNAGTHFANWFYGMDPYAYSGSADDGYFYEWHGTVQLSYWALRTFLNWTPGVAEWQSSGTHGKAPRIVDSLDARTWFNDELANRGIEKNWLMWMAENYSQTPGKGPAGAGGGGAAYWNNLVNNGNIYTIYEYDMQAYIGYNAVGLKLDPGNGTTANSLTIRFYYCGNSGIDAALIRMMEAGNVTGSIGKVGTSAWSNRGPIINYHDELTFNATIRENMGNSSARFTSTYQMLGWEDEATDVWCSGYDIELGTHPDYIPNVIGSQDTYPSPFNKYQLPGTGTTINDIYTGDFTKSRDWNAPGSLLFNTNASVCLQTPVIRNLTKYEAIVVDLNVLTAQWLVDKGWTAKFGGGTMALYPFKSANAVASVAKGIEYNNSLYWGTVVLGKGCYPANMTAMYNAATKILNYSGGTTGIKLGTFFNTEYWGGHVGQTSRVYKRGMPFIQLDVSPVSSYKVTVQPGSPRQQNTNYWVLVTPLDCLGKTPRTGAGALMVNSSVTFSSNDGSATWPGNGTPTTKAFTTANASIWSTVRFATINDNTYVNVTDVMFAYSVGGSAVPSPSPPVMTQAMTGTSGPMNIIIIPEFATVLIPIVGVMAMFFIFRTRKRKREE
jgi:hypothetical protein